MRVLEEGTAEYFPVDPDGFRAYVRDHKNRGMTPKLMSEQEAIARFVSDSDYLVYDCNYFQRGPASLIREVARQRKEDLYRLVRRAPPAFQWPRRRRLHRLSLLADHRYDGPGEAEVR
jgi:hypothetical protein